MIARAAADAAGAERGRRAPARAAGACSHISGTSARALVRIVRIVEQGHERRRQRDAERFDDLVRASPPVGIRRRTDPAAPTRGRRAEGGQRIRRSRRRHPAATGAARPRAGRYCAAHAARSCRRRRALELGERRQAPAEKGVDERRIRFQADQIEQERELRDGHVGARRSTPEPGRAPPSSGRRSRDRRRRTRRSSCPQTD